MFPEEIAAVLEKRGVVRMFDSAEDAGAAEPLEDYLRMSTEDVSEDTRMVCTTEDVHDSVDGLPPAKTASKTDSKAARRAYQREWVRNKRRGLTKPKGH